MKYLLSLLILLSSSVSYSQNLSPILNKHTVFGERAYMWMEFAQIPSTEEMSSMEKAGLHFISYPKRNTYWVSMPSRISLNSSWKHVKYSTIPIHSKLSEYLIKKNYPAHSLTKNGMIKLNVVFYDDISYDAAIRRLASKKIILIEQQKEVHKVVIQAKITNIQAIAGFPFVYYIEPISPEPTPENYTGGTLINIHNAYNYFPTNSKYNGDGIQVMLQDDGVIGPHIDYTGRVTHNVTTNSGDHGDHVAGIIAGAGNLNPLHRGMGWGAHQHVYSASDANYNLIPTIYTANNIVITSKSYGDGCNDGYTALSNQLDKQTRDYSALLHVFSCGNSGTSNCGYGVTGWGNITGGHKVGKNVLAIGNADLNGAINSSSSRGPAKDGRIKPDITAKGTSVMSTTDAATNPSQYVSKTGTSMACPMVSGTLTVLYQAYRAIHSGAYPYNALMKAILLNSAKDYGNPGPDFQYGFGIVDAGRAMNILQQNRYLIDSITHGANKSHTIAVPPGTRSVKVMIYWNDREATATGSTASALVNNINSTVVSNSVTHYPLVLDHRPIIASLSAPAKPGIDSINNVEQIVIRNPASTLTVNVNGFAIPFGPQKYCLVYDFIDSGIVLNHPVADAKLRPGQSEIIRWSTPDSTNLVVVKYSTNNGNTWTIANTVSAYPRQYTWLVPNIITDKLLFKVEQGDYVDSSRKASHIMTVPTNLAVKRNCKDSFVMTWDTTQNTSGYIVYRLGAKYMDSIAFVNKNRYATFCNSPINASYFAVAARQINGALSERTLAVYSVNTTYTCPTGSDIMVSDVLYPASNRDTFVLSCDGKIDFLFKAKIKNIGTSSASNYKIFYRIGSDVDSSLMTSSLAAGDSITFVLPIKRINLSSGNHLFKVWTYLNTDVMTCNDSNSSMIHVRDNIQLTSLNQNFESFSNCQTTSNCGLSNCQIPVDFYNEKNGGVDDIDWRIHSGKTPSGASLNTGPSIDANPSTSTGKYAYLEATNCFNKSASLTSYCLDITGIPNPVLSFQYHMYGLQVNNFAVDIFYNGLWNNSLRTYRGNKGNQWLKDSISLIPYKGNIKIRFRGATGSGDLGDIAIDDIQVKNLDTNSVLRSLNRTQCDSIVLFSKKYFNTGIYIDTVKGTKDTIYTLNLTIPKSYSNSVSVVANSSYVWQGITYTNSGVYTKKLTTSLNCDSTLILNLTIATHIKDTISVNGCDSVLFKNKKHYTSTTFIDTIRSTIDTFRTVKIIVFNSKSTFINHTAYNIYQWHGLDYTNSGIYSKKITLSNGCDSTVYLNLTIKNRVNHIVTKTFCDIAIYRNKTYSVSGTYYDSVKNTGGNDTLFTLIFDIRKATSQKVKLSACRSFKFGNTTLSQSGNYRHTFKSILGCDSIIDLELTIINHAKSIVLKGDSMISVNPGATFQWVNCGNNYSKILNATKAVYYPKAKGFYAVVIKTSTCTDTSNCLEFKTSSAINFPIESDEVVIYPNPTDKYFTVDVLNHKTSSPILLKLYSQEGRLIIERLVTKNEPIWIDQLPSGTYSLVIQAENKLYHKLLLKNK